MSDARPRDISDEQYAHLLRSLKLIQAGVKTRAPGIRRCHDCHTHYFDDTSGLPYCPECRTKHRRKCAHCHMWFTNTTAGDRLCNCCVHQTSLF